MFIFTNSHNTLETIAIGMLMATTFLVALDLARSSGMICITKSDKTLRRIYQEFCGTRDLIITPALTGSFLNLALCIIISCMYVTDVTRISLIVLAAFAAAIIPAMISLRKRSLFLISIKDELSHFVEE